MSLGFVKSQTKPKEDTVKELDDTPATAEYMGKPPRTLEQWRHIDCGPPYIKLGAAVRYRRSDVDAWLEANTVRPSGSAA